MATGKYSLKLPSGQLLTYDSPEELRAIYQRNFMADHLSKVLPSDVRSHMTQEADRLQKYITEELPQQREAMVKLVAEGKQNTFLGSVGAYMEAGMAWIDTSAEAGKLTPNPVTQAVSRVWLGSTQATKAALKLIEGKKMEAAENLSGALSQIPILGEAEKAKKVLSVANKSVEGTQQVMAGEYARGAATATQAAGDFVKNDVAGSAVQAAGATAKAAIDLDEMDKVESSLDSSLALFDRNAKNLEQRFAEKANSLRLYSSLAQEGESGDSSAILEAIRQQSPEIAREAEAALAPALKDATKPARDAAALALRKQAPESLDNYLEQQQSLDRSTLPDALPKASLPETTPATSKTSQYWFDPDDKDRAINLRDPDGKYARMPLDEAIAKGFVPEGTTVDQMTQYRVKDDQFLNEKDTSDRDVVRADRIADTEYSDGMTMPGGKSARNDDVPADASSDPAVRNEVQRTGSEGEFNPLQSDSQDKSTSGDASVMFQDSAKTQAVVSEASSRQAASMSGANWFRPGGDGSILDGPTFENWGGGGWNGGVRDDTPVCRPDWKIPNSKMDEAFRDHDYDYMRHGIEPDTPNSNPFKQAADLKLLENLKAIPDSELDSNSLFFKTSTELFFGRKASGSYDFELIAKLNSIPFWELDFEENVAREFANKKIQLDLTLDAIGYVSDVATDAAGYLGSKLNEASDLAKKKAEELGESLSTGYDDLTNTLNSLVNPSAEDAQPKWKGEGGSFSGAGSSSSWGDSAGGLSDLGGALGTGTGANDKSISTIFDEGDGLADNADGHADRAESAARRAESALRRAQRARARILARLRRSGCWVAREVYGEHDPRWLIFRSWLYSEAPLWFLHLYLRHGEAFAAWLKNHSLVKRVIRLWMDTIIASAPLEPRVGFEPTT